MGKILAFSGKATSGKTAAAIYLQDRLGGPEKAQRLSFAYELKVRAEEDFGEYFDPSDLTNNKTRLLNISGRATTIRQLLIDIGMMYRNIDKDFWLKRLTKRASVCANENQFALIDDMRFPNEYDTLKKMGAVLIRIERPGIQLINDESETSLDNHQFDHTITNDGTLEQYYAAIENAVKGLWVPS